MCFAVPNGSSDDRQNPDIQDGIQELETTLESVNEEPKIEKQKLLSQQKVDSHCVHHRNDELLLLIHMCNKRKTMKSKRLEVSTCRCWKDNSILPIRK